MFLARGGQVNGRGFGWVSRLRLRGLIGPSAWLGWGGSSWRSVLSLVPGIWEAPSLRDFPRREGEEGRPIMARGPLTEAKVASASLRSVLLVEYLG